MCIYSTCARDARISIHCYVYNRTTFFMLACERRLDSLLHRHIINALKLSQRLPADRVPHELVEEFDRRHVRIDMYPFVDCVIVEDMLQRSGDKTVDILRHVPEPCTLVPTPLTGIVDLEMTHIECP